MDKKLIKESFFILGVLTIIIIINVITTLFFNKPSLSFLAIPLLILVWLVMLVYGLFKPTEKKRLNQAIKTNLKESKLTILFKKMKAALFLMLVGLSFLLFPIGALVYFYFKNRIDDSMKILNLKRSKSKGKQ